ncbi:DUF2637 domain-containing protein [Micromonospora sp. SL1-18]|uniref:DUF2637 domain-containing protein n=1 Tax=Micromonospora sp. SL1-18 TaxID=3399128 RepID=UPI003A4E2A69
MVHVEKVDVPERPSKGAWVSVWLAFGAGIAASLAANIAHAGAGAGAKAVAGWAPLALLLCSEVMTRVPAPRHRLLKAAQVLGTIIVAGVAALASYRHMRGLAVEYGEDDLTANTLPLSVDGLVVVASIGLVVLSQLRRAAITAERAAVLARAAEQEAFLAAVAAAPVPPPPVPVPPAAVPVPPPDPVPPDGADENAAARKVWRDSVAAGEPLTGKALGDRFKRSERWGRNRIAEAKAELQAEQDAGGDVAGETDQQDARVPVGAGVA